MSEKVYPKGIRAWNPREGAPDFVKGAITIHYDTFTEWAADKVDEKGYVRLDLLNGRDGLYLTLNTYKKMPIEKPEEDYHDDGGDPDAIPF